MLRSKCMTARFAIILVFLCTCLADAANEVELGIGESLDLRQFGGPNVSIAVTKIDISYVYVAITDFSRVSGIGWNTTGARVEKTSGGAIFSSGQFKVLYLNDTSMPPPRVTLGIVSEPASGAR
jgi:hypothetical protein